MNVPNPRPVEDDTGFDATDERRCPDEFEISGALTSVGRRGRR